MLLLTAYFPMQFRGETHMLCDINSLIISKSAHNAFTFHIMLLVQGFMCWSLTLIAQPLTRFEM